MSLIQNIEDVLARLSAGASIIASPGCAQPTTLLMALAQHAKEKDGIRLYSGLQITYPFLDAIQRGHLHYLSWHPATALNNLVADGVVDYFPVRASQVPRLLAEIKADTVFVRVSPPDRHGFCSLGPSVSYTLEALKYARFVVAEIDEQMPRTFGASFVHESKFDAFITSEHPMPEYKSRKPSAEIEIIIKNILELLPENPMLQIGLGSIPEALVHKLADTNLGKLKLTGMISDAVVDLYQCGVIQQDDLYPSPPLLAVELMGTRRLMEFADLNPLLSMSPSTWIHEPKHVGNNQRFISINSALQMDLTGQINNECIGNRQISGIGGSVDFNEAARMSDGGLRILAFTSTANNGELNRIVPAISRDGITTIPRHSCDIVVTEYGVARMSALTLRERAEAMISIAHPKFRDELANEIN